MAAISFFAARPESREYFVGATFAAAVLCLLAWRYGVLDVRTVVLLALLFRLSLLWLPPVLSDDSYRYIWDGLVQREGINPYLYPPDASALSHLHGEPIFQELNSASYYSVYPPLSQLVFRFGALFYDHGWEASYFAIKIVFAAFEFGAVLLLSRLVDARTLVLYAWNPAVLIAAAGQPHGEAAAVFFLVLTWYLARRGKPEWASAALAGAALVKLYPVVLFPFLWRRYGWRSVWPGLLLAAALSAPYVHPAAPGHLLQSLDLYVRLFEFNAGFYYGIKKILFVVTGEDWSKQIGPALRVVYAGILPILYYLDWKRSWSLRRAFVRAIGAFFVLSTTIHPWYLLPVLALGLPGWPWQWAATASVGTYLLYTSGSYWIWVVTAWVGFAAIALARFRRSLVDRLLVYRARRKADLIVPLLPSHPTTLLDLGAGEGYVAREIVRRMPLEAQLADVVNLDRSGLPHIQFDGRRLPFEDDSFDAVIVIYVLHHAEKPEDLLLEADRVSRRRVIILESTFRKPWERRILELLDRMANRVRAGGRMSSMEEHLRFRTFDAWRAALRRLQLNVIGARELRGFIHHRAIFVIDSQKG